MLGRWMDFARAAVALPEAGEGGRWRRAVAPIIGLQAITHALSELDTLDRAQRRVGLDRAAVLIADHTREIHDIWRGEPIPDELRVLLADARATLSAATSSGLEWIVHTGAVTLDGHEQLADDLVIRGFEGDLYLAAPGAWVFEGEPVAFCRETDGVRPSERATGLIDSALRADDRWAIRAAMVPAARQVYREHDASSGVPVRDQVVWISDDPLPGRPLLIPVVQAGQRCELPAPIRAPDADTAFTIDDRTRPSGTA